MKIYWEADVQVHLFLTLAQLGGGSGQPHTLAALPLGKDLSVPLGQEAEWAPDPVRMTWKT
jgi:hypothetical protein